MYTSGVEVLCTVMMILLVHKVAKIGENLTRHSFAMYTVARGSNTVGTRQSENEKRVR